MTENTTPLTENIENLARTSGATAMRKITAHVGAQTGRLSAHLARSNAWFQKLPGVSRGTTRD